MVEFSARVSIALFGIGGFMRLPSSFWAVVLSILLLEVAMSEAAQQQLGLTLQAFAALRGLTVRQVRYLVLRGRVFGAKKIHGCKWFVFPPAMIVELNGKRGPRLAKQPAAGGCDVSAACVGAARRNEHGDFAGPEVVPEAQQDARRPRTQVEVGTTAPLLLTGFPSYYADPYLQGVALRIAAALEAIRRGGARLSAPRPADDDWGLL
jgi:hypothetical protein